MRRRLSRFEQRVYERFGSRPSRRRLTKALPLLLIASLGLWTFASPAFMRMLTPWVGAAALLCAGLFLGRVVLRIGHFSQRHAQRLHGERLRRLRRGVYKMIYVLVGTVLVAGGFFYLSTSLLTRGGPGAEPGLLWGLTVGGMVLALFFGELVTSLIELVDDVLEGGTEES